ncbi:rhodanese-like domain-containing protein [Natronosalvus vescus]|uniref:rhodanese-like domain-containing protein n=1 Tax=Natronosalvus vescus TaxID=2953881 RepID=UPI002090DB55|nr:rhodanese-like domain-containing protein [Natronosalvus vescus]
MDGEITIDDLHDLLERDDDVRIVDIRNSMQFEHGHIPGSENVPFHELTARIDEFDDADRVVTVCPVGKSSIQAARLLASYEGSADAHIESLAGGLDAWAESYELVSGSTEADTTSNDAADTDSSAPF